MILNRLRETAERYPGKTAVQMKSGERYLKYTYAELLDTIASVSRSLSDKGIGQGDRVALLSENRPEWIAAYLSVIARGAVIVPLDAQLTEKESAVLLQNSGAKAVFVSAATRHKIPAGSPVTVVSFDPGHKLLFADMLAYRGSALPSQPPGDQLAAILYTSGTTGDPKGVMLSHGNLASNAASCVKLDLVHPDDNMLLLLPLHHTYPAMTCMLLPFSVGATVTILNSLKGPDILACMAETKVTILLGVPQLFAGLRRAIFDGIKKKPAPVRALVKLLLGLNGFLRKKAGINLGGRLFGKVHALFGPSFRLMASGGARLEPDVYTDMNRLGFTVIEGYGLTETSPVSTFNPFSKQKAGSIGIPLPDVEVQVVNKDEQGQGEIVIRGPNVMMGYYNKPRETAAAIRDGWFHTGDLGYRDEEGYFFITGRSKEMIALSTGKKIFPDELEQFYRQIPSIKEICIVQTGRGIEAAVVPDFDYLRRMNLSNSREVIAFEIEDLAKDLPPYKRINGLKIFKEPFPVTRLGKLKRSQVRDLYLQSGERAEKQASEMDRGLLSTPAARKLLTCLEPFTEKKNIVPDDNLELDLGLDSLARVELVVSLEHSFGIRLPESFGSGIFTVRDAVLKLQDLLAMVPMKSGEQHVRLSWTEILAQEPGQEVKLQLQLDSGRLCTIAKFLLRSLLRVFLKTYNHLTVHGLENLPPGGPFIIAPNHLSLADAPAVMAAIPWRQGSQTFFLGTTAYFGGPVTSRIAKIVQVIPVDMESRLQGALQLSAYVLRRSKILCVFPEGSRSRGGRIKEFKKGVGIVARELNIPVVPVGITGTYEALAPGKKMPRPAVITVRFGKPVYPGDMDYDAIVGRLSDAVSSLLGES